MNLAIFIYLLFSLLVIETLQNHFFFNNTKSIAENSIVKHLEKFHNVFEGHLISLNILNIPMLLLLLCGYLIFLIISTSSFLKIWNQRTCLVLVYSNYKHKGSNIGAGYLLTKNTMVLGNGLVI